MTEPTQQQIIETIKAKIRYQEHEHCIRCHHAKCVDPGAYECHLNPVIPFPVTATASCSRFFAKDE